jgi:hypothetical protein
MTARLPIPGSDNNNWGTVLNDYLQQALASDGKLVTAATNPYTASANTNLATGSVPGLVQLATDLGGTASAPQVVATHLASALPVAQGGTGLGSLTSGSVIIGNGATAPTFVAPGTTGNVLTSSGGAWVSQAASSGGGRTFAYFAS